MADEVVNSYKKWMSEGNDNLTPCKAIKKYCYQCSGYSYSEVHKCECAYCPLYKFRLGHNPKRTRKKQ